MKNLLILVFLLMALKAFSQEHMKMREFHESMNQNIGKVLDDNPQVYEKKSPARKGSRGPASAEPVETIIEDHERYKERYDKGLGLREW